MKLGSGIELNMCRLGGDVSALKHWGEGHYSRWVEGLVVNQVCTCEVILHKSLVGAVPTLEFSQN